MFFRLTIICWVLILVVIPILATVAWLVTDDAKVFIMIPGALLFVGLPWLVVLMMQKVISSGWR